MINDKPRETVSLQNENILFPKTPDPEILVEDFGGCKIRAVVDELKVRIFKLLK